MKKIIFIMLMISAAACAAFSQTGTIREFTGEVEVKNSGSSAFIPAKEGMVIRQDTIISTGFKSTAIITVGGNTITVRPLTRLSFAEISSSSNTEKLNVNLQAGRVRVDVRPAAGTRASTTIQGPSSTASVRGTSFEIDTSNISVFDGRVAWAGSDGLAVPVIAGSSSYVTEKGVAANPAILAASDSLPAAPVGTGSAGESTSSSSSSSDGLNITLEWGDTPDAATDE
jgi:hypothetical protein